MGISLEQYRVSIGLYHKCISSSKELFKVYFNLVFLLQAIYKLCKFFVKHYLLRCSNFIDERVTLFQTTRDFHPLNVNTLLFGGDGLSNEDNIRIFSAVQLFIKDSKRFAN